MTSHMNEQITKVVLENGLLQYKLIFSKNLQIRQERYFLAEPLICLVNNKTRLIFTQTTFSQIL